MSDKKQKLTARDFVHLHNHTQHSLLDGLTKIPALLDFVKETGMEAAAITDHGTLSGTLEFYKEANSRGLKPIIGLETYVAARKLTDKDPAKDKARFHLILLAMNNQGYQNLMKLSTIANLDGFYYYPRVDHELLEKYNEGLIAMSGCMSGEVGEALKNDQYDKAKEVAAWYKKVFGDRYYLEVQDHGHPDNPLTSPLQEKINEGIFKLAKELTIPVVLTCDAHYLRHEDQDAHEVLLCVGTGSFLSDEKRMTLKDFPLHVEDPKNLIKRWGKYHPEVIANTRKIAERCDVNIELGKILIPKFDVPKKETEKSYLELLTFKGLVNRYLPSTKPAKELTALKEQLPKNIVKRAEYELSVMDKMGYNGYFLIVQDFINWSKDKGIVFGPGRGSAAGSIVSYALRITEIDPLKYDLIFERFLNPGRISMPDIDIDIQDTRRNEVIEYCINKYGDARVANIVTFGRMAARNAVRDVARVLQVPYAEADRLAKMLPPPVQGRHIPLEKSLKENPELKKEYKENETAKKVFDLAVQLEGTIRSHGVHAAGVVIAPDDVVKFSPLERAQKGVIATQYSMGPIEELGLLKMDFLGLSNLTILRNAQRIVKKVYKKSVMLEDLPLDDKKTLDIFAKGETTGVFQFESGGMRQFLSQLKVTQFEDLIACNALYRPGPMAQFPGFIKGKNKPDAVTYMSPALEPVLKETYGVIVFQEQVTQLLQAIAGYTFAEADLVRKAIGKKKRDIMRAEEPRFIEGCLKKGLDKKGAEKLWALIQPFADYSFNKAHATCYAMIAYQTAYFKAHYPDAYMAALMTSAYGDADRLSIEIAECKRLGIDVLPPDVNESFHEFAVVPGKNQIRFGLDSVKNVGHGAVEEIIRAREEAPFENLEDYLTRVSVRTVNKKALESLIKAGALDRFGDRLTLLANIETLLAYGARQQKAILSSQTDLFGNEITFNKPMLTLNEVLDPIDSHEQLKWERELLGLYLSRHPLERYEAFLAAKTMPLNNLKPALGDKPITAGGTVAEAREITTKNGQKMAFVRLEDQFGSAEVIVFPKVYKTSADLFQRDKVILVNGKVSGREKDGRASDELKIMADSAREITLAEAAEHQTQQKVNDPLPPEPVNIPESPPLDVVNSPEEPAKPERLYLRLTSTDDQSTLLSLKKTIDESVGNTEVVLVLGDKEKRQAIKLPTGIDKNGDGVNKLRDLVGEDNLVLR